MSWNPNQLEEQRLAKLEKLRQAGLEPYPRRTARTHTVAAALAEFDAAAVDEADPASGPEVVVAGRLVSLRDMGKTVFGHLEDATGRLQLFARREEVGEESHLALRKLCDLGDFVEASGRLFRTRAGEVSVRVSTWRMLSKALSPLPVVKEQEVDGELLRYGAFSDIEERYRQRYADLAVNPDVRAVFVKRARLISALRRFMDDGGFLEVETPILQPLYGGAAARPFTTFHNQLKQDLYLRISFELYLKRLLVGNFEKVYELGRDFRNEGVSFKHNPEFTQLEFYAAYWDYDDVAAFVEQLCAASVTAVNGSPQLVYQGATIDLTPPWRRITLRAAILEYSGIDYVDHPSAASLGEAMKAIGAHVPEGATWGRLVDTLLGDFVEKHLVQPTFLMNYPRDISPLAKKMADDPTHVERWEMFIGGMEMGNAFTELNDPQDQLARFQEMQQLYAADDDEAHPIDEDYLRAMRYGMPPNGGFGMGVDRLAMLVSDQTTIREVLLFPHLREKENQ